MKKASRGSVFGDGAQFTHEFTFETATGGRGRVKYRRIPVRGGHDIEAVITSERKIDVRALFNAGAEDAPADAGRE